MEDARVRRCEMKGGLWNDAHGEFKWPRTDNSSRLEQLGLLREWMLPKSLSIFPWVEKLGILVNPS